MRFIAAALAIGLGFGIVQATGAPQPPSVLEFTSSGDAAFDGWRDDFAQRAVAAGRDAFVVRQLLEGVAPDPRVIQSDRNQPEFVRPVWDYLARAASPERVAAGKAAIADNLSLLDAVERQTGVDKHVIAGIWGIETSFGAAPLPHAAPVALATLAAEGRRRAQFETYLLALIQMIERGYVSPTDLKSSWAGALGQPQFMPDIYLTDAVDWNGDGKRDIWTDRGDVFASIANYLTRRGWIAGAPVFDEVVLPANFDYRAADGSVRPVAAWQALGVARRDGAAAWPASASGLSAELFLPAGAAGPALLLYPNFAVIRRYNPSDRYALAVALLARGYADEPGIVTPWPTAQGSLQRSDFLDLQTLLAERGYDPGKIDGLFGGATRRAVREFQTDAGLPADGWPTPALLERLRGEANRVRLEARRTSATAITASAEIRSLQATLNGLGYKIGTPNGKVGPKTRAAIRAFEQSLGLEPTGLATSFVKEEAETALTSRRRARSGGR